jgi:hypothetical protein
MARDAIQKLLETHRAELLGTAQSDPLMENDHDDRNH